MSFPKNFLWGTSVSAAQIEGGPARALGCAAPAALRGHDRLLR